jgi:hypothetical protein
MADAPGARMRWLALAAAAAALLAALTQSVSPLTSGARGYAEDVAATSAATYVSLRTLNAFLSTAQEIEVGGAFVVSGTAQPLKVLEPLDDTIERIAGVVFGVMVISGVLAVALGPVSAMGFGLLALAALSWAAAPRRLGALPRRIGLYGGFLGLAVPLVFLLASLMADRMTARVWEEHQTVIAELAATVGADELPDVEEGGWWLALQERLGGVERYQAVAAALYENADAIIASYIAILSVFLFRLLVLPLMLAGGFWLVARQLAI